MRERIHSEMSLEEKLNILSDAAKYDVSCTSWRGTGTAPGWGTAETQGSVTVFRQMEDVFLCSRSCLQMSVSMTVNIALTDRQMML